MSTADTNIASIVAAYKKELPKNKMTSLATGAATSIFGKDLGQLAGIMPGLIGGALDKVFSLPSAWSRSAPVDKENLIQALAQEAVWIKNLSDYNQVVAYMLGRLVDTSVINKDQQATFIQKNDWVVGRIQGQINDYKAKLQLANDIVDFTKAAVMDYENSKNTLIAVNAINKQKKGQTPTADELTAIAQYLKEQNAVAISKSLRKG